jgi:hypothetical protein
MAFGILILTIALADDFVGVLRGGPPSYPDDAAPIEDSASAVGADRER